MAIVVEATYENGVLRPAQPLPLAEHEKVCGRSDRAANKLGGADRGNAEMDRRP